jgi:hypothetical protein
MSTTSDVALAIKQELLDKLSSETKENITKWFGKAREKDDGWQLFFVSNIRWSSNEDGVDNLYQELDEKDIETVYGNGSYLIVEACHDYPESDDGTAGRGFNNPWKICKNVSVCIGSLDGDLS